MSEPLKPRQIEDRSFEIIEEELEVPVDPEYKDLIYRVVHATADLDLAEKLEFKNGAVQSGIQALKNGADIYADTGMIVAGVSKKSLEGLGSRITSMVHDKDVVREAGLSGRTRSEIAIDKAFDHGFDIYAIGNAPTALFELIRKIKETGKKPALILGVPVGFVGAAESKKALDELDGLGVPYIRQKRRKPRRGRATKRAAL